ncbi:MAG: DUF1289 domain-containing protein [Neorhizobium sp.]|nr:DUF1289 domain-containing protein [Neorhizobium sp.]
MITPCVHICVIAPRTSLCTGCGRTLDEIAAWSGYSQMERRTIMDALPARLAAVCPSDTPCGSADEAEERVTAA